VCPGTSGPRGVVPGGCGRVDGLILNLRYLSECDGTPNALRLTTTEKGLGRVRSEQRIRVPLCTVLAPLYRHYSPRNAILCSDLQKLLICRKMLAVTNLFAFRWDWLKRLLTAGSEVRVLVGEPFRRLTHHRVVGRFFLRRGALRGTTGELALNPAESWR